MKLRVVAAVAVLVSAFVHLKLWFDGFRHDHVVGPAFMLNAVGGLVIAVLLLTWRHWVPAFLALGFGVSTLAAFTVATLPSGLFGVHEHWVGAYTWTAAIAEAVAAVTGATLLWRELPRRVGSQSTDRSGNQAQHGLTLRRAHLD